MKVKPLFHKKHLLSTFLVVTTLIVLGLCTFSCSTNPTTQSKASSVLLLQVALRQEQLASPVPAVIGQMQGQGMNTANLGVQRIFIYLKQPLTPAQVNELQALGITLYLNSWIPPADNNLDGFYLADMPVDKLDALAAKDYIVRLDTAEKQLKPQSDVPQGGIK